MSFSNQKKSKVDWFPVSVNVFDDIKISMLRLKYGNNGFVFYTVMVTEIYRSGTYSFQMSDDKSDLNNQLMILHLSNKMGIPTGLFEELWDFCIQIGLFDYTDGRLTNNEINKHVSYIEENRERHAEKKKSDKDRQKKHRDKQNVSQDCHADVTNVSQDCHADVTNVSQDCHADVTNVSQVTESASYR